MNYIRLIIYVFFTYVVYVLFVELNRAQKSESRADHNKIAVARPGTSSAGAEIGEPRFMNTLFTHGACAGNGKWMFLN